MMPIFSPFIAAGVSEYCATGTSAVVLSFSSFPEITHCYERSPVFEGKYNLFSMIHLHHPDIEEKIEAISAATGIHSYLILTSEEEFKKSSMEYFA